VDAPSYPAYQLAMPLDSDDPDIGSGASGVGSVFVLYGKILLQRNQITIQWSGGS